ncbi:FkbM family methyltransferase [Crocinitomix algicola]|uniref:FkbM family methyltransferase n=1 Tax=Crocinitomix algicola TaxID=1740263 RepID=UPI00082AE77D|nr:FkbM family methyltransferase [Crocinitomix algicola]
MKNFIKLVLQKLLGYERYLRVFSNYKIKTLKSDEKEKDFFAFVNSISKEGIILDVGANIGIMTYHLSKSFPNRKVIGIEPMPNNFKVLQDLVLQKKLNNVELYQNAVGEGESTIEMILPMDGKVKMQGLAHVVHDTIKEWNEGETFTVQCLTLDDIVAGETVAGIKMDIENFEYFALKGARHILTTHKPIVYLELWENENRDNCFELLRTLGYHAYVLVDGKLNPYDPASHKKQNFIFK